MGRYRTNIDEEQAIEYLKNEIIINKEKYNEIEKKGEPTGYGTMHDIYKLNIYEYTIILNLIDKLKDMLENNVHYIRCEKCGCEVRTKKRQKYCDKCRIIIRNIRSKEYQLNLSDEERKEKHRIAIKKYREKHIEKIKEYQKQYRQTETYKQAQKKYREKHKEEIKEYQKQYRKNKK